MLCTRISKTLVQVVDITTIQNDSRILALVRVQPDAFGILVQSRQPNFCTEDSYSFKIQKFSKEIACKQYVFSKKIEAYPTGEIKFLTYSSISESTAFQEGVTLAESFL